MVTSVQKTAVGLDAPMLPELFRVTRVQRETRDTVTVEMQRAAGGGLLFEPGQFNMIYMRGSGEVPISISGDPTQPDTLVHTVRAVGAVSTAMCNLRPGDQVGIRGPFGTSWPTVEAEGNDVVVVAGGIGLAPLRPMIYHLLANRQKYGNVNLLYGARTPGDLLYTRQLEQWRGRFDLEVEVTVDTAAPGWRGHVGLVTTVIPHAQFDPRHTTAVVCGPEIMMRFVIMELQKRGLNSENIFVSMERNMKCGVGLCGHCQFGHDFICKDGPVFPFDRIAELFGKREI